MLKKYGKGTGVGMGWHSESERHRLARLGIKTGSKINYALFSKKLNPKTVFDVSVVVPYKGKMKKVRAIGKFDAVDYARHNEKLPTPEQLGITNNPEFVGVYLEDTDKDGVPDIYDADKDGDGVPNWKDDERQAFPIDAYDMSDKDFDFDGVPNNKDLFPLDPTKAEWAKRNKIDYATKRQKKGALIGAGAGLVLGGNIAGGVIGAGIGYHATRKYKKVDRAKKNKSDFIDKLMSYESGDLSYEEETKFLKEVKSKGLHNTLQGHYGREIVRRGL